MTAPSRPPLGAVVVTFLRIGAQGFGGLGAVLALVTRELVERRGWLGEADVTEALTYTKLLPGSTVVQVVAYLGWRLGGLAGALLGTTAFVLPSFAMMLALAVGYLHFAALSGVTGAVLGLGAAVVGLLAATTWMLGRKNAATPWGVAVAISAGGVSIAFQLNPAAVVIAAGLLGILLEATKRS